MRLSHAVARRCIDGYMVFLQETTAPETGSCCNMRLRGTVSTIRRCKMPEGCHIRLLFLGCLVQGLEVEVQRLINRHRAELESAHERAAEQVKAALDGAKAEQQTQLQELREKLRKVSSSKLVRARVVDCCVQRVSGHVLQVSHGAQVLSGSLLFVHAQQQDEAIERERCAAAARLCEASERWEAQLQASRMRLVADNDMKVRAPCANCHKWPAGWLLA